MVRQRQGHLLRDWIQKAELSGPAAIGIFADFVRQDLDAVTAGLYLPYSSGVAEGHVNRIKTIKRQMYGRASFTLLRARILLQPQISRKRGQNLLLGGIRQVGRSVTRGMRPSWRTASSGSEPGKQLSQSRAGLGCAFLPGGAAQGSHVP